MSQARSPPPVCAVTDALGRLEEGDERQRRFIASAAHELRTPIAVPRVKLEASPEVATRRLSSDVNRLGNLAGQLLDLQRLDGMADLEAVDILQLVRQVAADLAPLLISARRMPRDEPLQGAYVGAAGDMIWALRHLGSGQVG
jgi:two-component system, OmpR family, sensor histidine kinase TctE